ncbi:MAG: hypothetical protein ACK5JM_01765 [Rhodoblastus sp.]
MIFARAMLVACAMVLGGLFFFIAVLLVVLAIVNFFRADGQGGQMGEILAVAFGAVLAGFVCRFIGRKIA